MANVIMANVIEDVYEALSVALRSAPDPVRVWRLEEPAVPPGVVLGPPALAFEGYCGCGPTTITVPVWVVVANDERTTGSLYELVLAVAARLETVADASVLRATPGTAPISAGSPDLPAYQIDVEVSP